MKELTCRSCGVVLPEAFLSLGEMPLANSLLTDIDSVTELNFPLDVVFCSVCSLVQITETVPAEILFRDYFYFSSFSETMLEHAGELAARMRLECKLDEESLVVEIASNDGYLLQHYRAHGIPILGIEPAVNIARVARERGIETIDEFFTRDLADELVSKSIHADLIHAHNVLAHVSDLNGFVAGMYKLLKPTGTIVIEVPYVVDLINHVEFDTIYHEHLCYYSLSALDSLFSRHGLTIGSVEHLQIHGGSLRIFAGKQIGRQQSVVKLLADEQISGVTNSEFYRDFGARVSKQRDALLAQLNELWRSGNRIAAYGASAKGSTLLNYCKLPTGMLEYVVDRSTVKQGLFTPGTHLKIYAPDKLDDDRPDYVLLLTWNFMDEILNQRYEYRRTGGRFIVPLPEVRMI